MSNDLFPDAAEHKLGSGRYAGLMLRAVAASDEGLSHLRWLVTDPATPSADRVAVREFLRSRKPLPPEPRPARPWLNPNPQNRPRVRRD